MTHQKPRRGIVLLIVLSLLTLFALLMVTFLVISGQYERTALVTSRINQTGDHPKKLLDSAMYLGMRGTRDPHNPMRGHSILNDMNGHEGFKSPLAVDATGMSGIRNQFHQYQITVNTSYPADLNGTKTSLSPTSGYYNGCVLSVISGTGRGLSTRIVGYDAGTATFTVLPLHADFPQLTAPKRGDFVLINGHPFNGTGFGHIVGTDSTHPFTGIGQLDRLDPGPDGKWGIAGVDDDSNGVIDDPSEAMAQFSDDGWSALFPNRASTTNMVANQAMFVNFMSGGADESYDAIDYQNMLLAMLPPSATSDSDIIPSLHRPALINFWFNYIVENWLEPAGVVTTSDQWKIFLQPYGPDNRRNSGDEYWIPSDQYFFLLDQVVRLKQRIIFRPLPELNPQFTGSNPDYSLLATFATASNPYIVGPWDVDCDGDGINDSIWFDPDSPVQAAPDGRLMKPLFAYLWVDLGGRANVNAHGKPETPAGAYVDPKDLARNPAAPNLQRGRGIGPPEIDLSYVFTASEVSKLLIGDSATGIPGRYGSITTDRDPGIGNGANPPSAFSPGKTLDAFAEQKFYQYPLNYFNPNPAFLALNHRGFHTPPDLLGELVVGSDHRGQPQYTIQNPIRHILADSAYELDLSSVAPRGALSPRARDYPFTVTELERVLRAQDFDRGLLPSRLGDLASTTFADAEGRRSVTTDSFDVPVPQLHYPVDMLEKYLDAGLPTLDQEINRRPTHVLDILRARVFDGIKTVPGAATEYRNNLAMYEARLSSHYTNLLAPGFLMGTRMDVNYPIGNGRDDNGNLVIDEHWQGAAWAYNEATGGGGIFERVWGVPFDHDNDGSVGSADPDAFLARQHLARRLYTLMMILKHEDYQIDDNGDGSTSSAETARAIAQWAINVVDFRDPDSIMTPFEYDPTPFVPHKGTDGEWGVGGVDDDGINGVDDIGEMFFPGSDDTLWRPDGWLGIPPGGTVAIDYDTESTRVGLVWGCERPELLLTETIAIHDRRTEDLVSPNEKTDRLDAGGDLIGETDFEAGMGENDFDQRFKPLGSLYFEIFNAWTSEQERKPAELCSNANPNSPVLLNKRSNGGAGSPVWRVMIADTMIDPDEQGAMVTASRVIYFAAGGVTPAGATAYTSVTPAPLYPGRYAVVGTYRSQDNVGDPAGTTSAGAEYVNQIGIRGDADTSKSRRFVFHAEGNANQNWFYVLNNNDTLPDRLLFPSATNAGVVDIQPPVAVPVLNLEISEGNYSSDPAVNPYDPATGFLAPFDLPFDQNPARWEDPALGEDGTHVEFRRVFLQRLANPMLAYDAVTNPYRVIDWMPVDLTVYNGLHDPDDMPDPSLMGGPSDRFQTRERGLAPVGAGVTPERLIWNNRNEIPMNSTEAISEPLAGNHYSHKLTHTLGYLNSTYGDRFKWDFQMPPVPTPPHELAPGTSPANNKLVGAPNYKTDLASGVTRGEPFPWLTWNNRPYVSQYELMMVPRTRSSKLTETFSLPAAATSAYDPTDPDDPSDAAYFGHLLNFFATRGTVIPSDADLPLSEVRADFCRLFDYTHVPSRFLGTEIWLDKDVFKTTAVGTFLRHPPFNRIPSYREPGKLNANTILATNVYSALQGANSPGPTASTFVDSRRGYSAASLTTIDGNRPSMFNNPFRSSGAAHMVPLTTQSLAQLDSMSFDASEIAALNMERPPTESTLLRSDRLAADTTAPDLGDPSMFIRTTGPTYQDPDRSPYYRFQSLQRLGNLVTTRSNVYAVWITVGYFEVDPLTGALGQEIGVVSGDVKRHRAFYIIDRSIPVAFEPGENHNVDRAILLRRFIE